ncbi:MAG: Fe-S cluster-containing oxidoreductase [Thermodesulfobacterium sp.]|uniref:Fe-S cluster-containing oxidoreductase n=1 Tax=Candidatus Thermodesulfobacterium syntrophicum TaxID=3060442 RepID=A0AAE3P1H8_9BACT|nr:Fe-S cluster-containing oxidoreductase [Candidatus Thermodesulfobacterium syntrophicum]
MKIQNIKKKISLCNRCGKCVPVCPSFKIYKTEAFSPRGRIFLISHEKEHQSFDFCLFCERCERVCPHNISFPEVYLEKLKRKKKIVFSENIPHSISKDPLLIFLRINNWLHLIDFTKEQQVEFRYGEGDIVIYESCGLKHFYPQAFKNFEGRLKKRGINAGIPRGLVCCGAIFLNLGLISQLKENALKNLEILEKTKGPIVVFCATCLWMFKKIYPQIFKNTAYEKRFSELSQRVISAYGYLSLEMESELRVLEERALDENVLFHLPCHLTEEFNLVKKKLEVKDFCCGSAKFFLWLKGFQKENKREWIKNLETKSILATHCTGCYLNFNLLLKRPPLVCHWLELL